MVSVSDLDVFWVEYGKWIDWFKLFLVVKNMLFIGDVLIKWFEDGEMNVFYNCIDCYFD